MSCYQVSFFLQGKAPKGIHVILTEKLAFFVPGGAKDLSAPKETCPFPVEFAIGIFFYFLLKTFFLDKSNESFGHDDRRLPGYNTLSNFNFVLPCIIV